MFIVMLEVLIIILTTDYSTDRSTVIVSKHSNDRPS